MNLKHKIGSKTDHSCVPKLAGMEFKVKLENHKKITKKDVSVFVHTIVRHLIYEFLLASCQSQLT